MEVPLECGGCGVSGGWAGSVTWVWRSGDGRVLCGGCGVGEKAAVGLRSAAWAAAEALRAERLREHLALRGLLLQLADRLAFPAGAVDERLGRLASPQPSTPDGDSHRSLQPTWLSDDQARILAARLLGPSAQETSLATKLLSAGVEGVAEALGRAFPDPPSPSEPKTPTPVARLLVSASAAAALGRHSSVLFSPDHTDFTQSSSDEDIDSSEYTEDTEEGLPGPPPLRVLPEALPEAEKAEASSEESQKTPGASESWASEEESEERLYEEVPAAASATLFIIGGEGRAEWLEELHLPSMRSAVRPLSELPSLLPKGAVTTSQMCEGAALATSNHFGFIASPGQPTLVRLNLAQKKQRLVSVSAGGKRRTWSQRRGCVMVALAEGALVVGGAEERGPVSRRTEWVPYGRKGQTVAGPLLAVGRRDASAAELDGFVYVFGGLDGEGRVLRSTEVLDARAWAAGKGGGWAAGPELPVGLAESAASALGDVVVVAGGRDGEGKARAEVWALDWEGGRWTEGGRLNGRRWGHRLVPALHCLLAVGGRGDSGAVGHSLELWSPERPVWRLLDHRLRLPAHRALALSLTRPQP